MKINPYLGAAAQGAIAAMTAEEEWQLELARRKKWYDQCHAFLDSVVRANLLLAAEASQHWGYDVDVSAVSKTENHTGKIYLRSSLQIDVSGTPSRLEFILSIDSRIFTAEAVKKTGRKLFGKFAVEDDDRIFFVEHAIKEFLKWAVI